MQDFRILAIVRKIRWWALAIVMVALIPLGIPGSSADVFTRTISVPNSSLSGFTGPYATVTVTTPSPNSTTATVAFTSLTNGGFIYLMGDGGAANLNVNAASFALGAVTESNSISGFTPSFANNTPGTVDGLGTFNLSLNNNNGFTDSATSIGFTLTNTSGTWASAGDVLAGNASGFGAGIHGFACAQPGCSTTSEATATGFAGDAVTPLPSVPEPGTLGLLGVGVAGLGYLRWRRRGAESER
jgi:hypothetical protein